MVALKLSNDEVKGADPVAAGKKKATSRKKEAPKCDVVDQKMVKALAHPLRVRCLALLNDRQWSPRELSVELDEGLSQISYHIRMLKKSGLIELASTAPRRGATEHFYRAVHRVIVPEGLTAALPKSARLGILGDILKEIDTDVAASLKAGTFHARHDFHASWTPMDLDEQGCRDAAERTDRFMEELLDIQAEVVERRAQGEGGEESIPISAAILLFGSDRAAGDGISAACRKRS